MIFGQNIEFNNDEIYFYSITDQQLSSQSKAQVFSDKPRLKIENLPSNTRLVLSLILLPETFSTGVTQYSLPKREGFIYGSVTMPLFDLNRRMKQGNQRLLVWPLQKFDERFICMGECYRYKEQKDIDRNFENNLNIVVEMPRYHTDVFWDLGQDISNASSFKVAMKAQKEGAAGPAVEVKNLFPENEKEKHNITSEETKQIHKIREIINAFPLETEQEGYDRHLVQKYRHFVLNIAMFIRSIDFTNKDEVAMCYNFLETSDQAKNCKPEDALALLDAEFGDERIRLFAVTKLSQLNDTFLSLYVPQLAQALKYEQHHKSPLSEFLLERSLENPRVVGHAFFWSLRAGLHEMRSYERFYLILERFLMCCGKYKYELFRQNTVNTALIKVHHRVQNTITRKKQEQKTKKEKIDVKYEAEKELYAALKEQEFAIKIRQAIILD
jgi:hypothetical protein